KAELLRVNRALRVLSGFNKNLVHARNEEELLKDTCRTIVEAGDYRMAWIGFAQHDSGKTVIPAWHYGHEEGYLLTAQITWADTERGRGPTGTAIRTGAPCVIQNIAAAPAMIPWRDSAVE